MDEKIEVIKRDVEFTLEIKDSVPMWKMGKVIGESYKLILEQINKNNAECSGFPFVKYINIDWDKLNSEKGIIAFIKMFMKKWDMVIGFPVKSKVEGNENILGGVIPAGNYIKTIHKGPYQKVGNTYKKVFAFMNKENLKPVPESIEFYVNDPKTTKKEDLETIILVQLKD